MSRIIENEADGARAPKGKCDCRFEEGKVVALDPELVNIVWDFQSNLGLVHPHKGNALEPPLKGVLAYSGANFARDPGPKELKIGELGNVIHGYSE